MAQKRNVRMLLAQKPGERKPVESPTCRWEDIKIDLKQRGKKALT
jgi:hypothetical protein